jgi:hypothetical protein
VIEKVTGVLSDYSIADRPDENCITLPNGVCVGGVAAGKSPCMHDIRQGYFNVVPSGLPIPDQKEKRIGEKDPEEGEDRP